MRSKTYRTCRTDLCEICWTNWYSKNLYSMKMCYDCWRAIEYNIDPNPDEKIFDQIFYSYYACPNCRKEIQYKNKRETEEEDVDSI